jgi:hypothetical protein
MRDATMLRGGGHSTDLPRGILIHLVIGADLIVSELSTRCPMSRSGCQAQSTNHPAFGLFRM